MNEWVDEQPIEVLVCDTRGTIVEMNQEARNFYQEDGGSDLLGRNILDCHPGPARTKLAGLMDNQTSNAYTSTETGEKRFFFQSPWFLDNQYAGFIEISFPIPEQVPHFVRN